MPRYGYRASAPDALKGRQAPEATPRPQSGSAAPPGAGADDCRFRGSLFVPQREEGSRGLTSLCVASLPGKSNDGRNAANSGGPRQNSQYYLRPGNQKASEATPNAARSKNQSITIATLKAAHQHRPGAIGSEPAADQSGILPSSRPRYFCAYRTL